jgi:hypothetical protein
MHSTPTHSGQTPESGRSLSQPDMFQIDQGSQSDLNSQALLRSIDAEADVQWDEQAVVDLHWLLLTKIDGLRDPLAPLEEKFELLRWIFTDREHDRMPFSFACCLEVVGTSPLSPTAYFGKLCADDIRSWILNQLKAWFSTSLHHYPAWIQSEILHHPDWVAHQLEKNPQWINQQIKQSAVQSDLFS